jgi:hypothetical protein
VERGKVGLDGCPPCYGQEWTHNIVFVLRFLKKKGEKSLFSIGKPIDMSETDEYN